MAHVIVEMDDMAEKVQVMDEMGELSDEKGKEWYWNIDVVEEMLEKKLEQLGKEHLKKMLMKIELHRLESMMML